MMQNPTRTLVKILSLSVAFLSLDLRQASAFDTFTSPTSNTTSHLPNNRPSMVILDPVQIKATVQDTLKTAQHQIIISSPYISVNALKNYGIANILNAKGKAGVRSAALLSSELTHSKNWETAGIALLEENNVRVHKVNKLHAKYILVDEKALILGSYNFLSGSLNPKDKYYLMNLIMVLPQMYVHAAMPHCLYIANNEAPTVPLTQLSPQIDIMSASDDITRVQRALILNATNNIEICSPNLNLNMIEYSGFLDLLGQKTRMGVNVIVYSDQQMDHKSTDYFEVREKLKQNGVRVITKKGFHCKYIIADNKDLYFGSDNMFAGAGLHSGAGFWKEMGILARDAFSEIAEIRRHMETVPVVEDSGRVIETTSKASSPFANLTQLSAYPDTHLPTAVSIIDVNPLRMALKPVHVPPTTQSCQLLESDTSEDEEVDHTYDVNDDDDIVDALTQAGIVESDREESPILLPKPRLQRQHVIHFASDEEDFDDWGNYDTQPQSFNTSSKKRKHSSTQIID